MTVLFICLSGFLGLAQAQQPNKRGALGLPDQTEVTYSFVLKNAEIGQMIEKLKDQLGLPVCFEMEELDPSTQGIRARDRLRMMKEQGSDLSSVTMMESIAKEHPDSIVGWKLPRYDFAFKNATVPQIVKSLFEKYQNYRYQFDNTYLIVCPKTSILDFRVPGMRIQSKSIAEALHELAPIFEQKKISIMSPIKMISGMADPQKAQISQISLDDSTLGTTLTRLCQASSPLTTWSLTGMKGGRILTILPAQTKSRGKELFP